MITTATKATPKITTTWDQLCMLTDWNKDSNDYPLSKQDTRNPTQAKLNTACLDRKD